MDEKQRLQEAEAAQMDAVKAIPPPPAYADVEVSVETIEVVTAAPSLPGWITRLPVTLPLAHFMFSVPLALFFARSFGGAVFVCSAVSFWLVASSTAGIARATRHDIRLQKAGVRYLGAAGMIMVAWPFLVAILLAPGHMHMHIPGCSKMMRHHNHHNHGSHGSHGHNMPPTGFVRTFHLHHAAHVAAAAPNAPAPVVATPVNSAVSSSKGNRVLVAAVGHQIEQIKQMFPKIHAAGVRVVVSSKGVKALLANELHELHQLAAAPVETPVEESQEELR